MNQLALMTIIEYRNKSLEICKELVKEGRVIEANVILELLQNNIVELVQNARD